MPKIPHPVPALRMHKAPGLLALLIAYYVSLFVLFGFPHAGLFKSQLFLVLFLVFALVLSLANFKETITCGGSV